jgi:hypothetical protein
MGAYHGDRKVRGIALNGELDARLDKANCGFRACIIFVQYLL